MQTLDLTDPGTKLVLGVVVSSHRDLRKYRRTFVHLSDLCDRAPSSERLPRKAKNAAQLALRHATDAFEQIRAYAEETLGVDIDEDLLSEIAEAYYG